MKKLAFNHRKSDENLRSLWRVTGWAIFAYERPSNCMCQYGDKKNSSIAGNLHLEEVTCGAQLSKATLSTMYFLFILHSQLLIYVDFSMTE